jgi:hypothetical protein
MSDLSVPSAGVVPAAELTDALGSAATYARAASEVARTVRGEQLKQSA